MSDFDLMTMFSGWRRMLWHEISQAAQAENAFSQDDYDEYGDLNIRLDKFKELAAWLSRRREAQLETFKPTWRCTTDRRWELAFRSLRSTADERTVDGAPGPSAESKKRIVRKTTGINVEGLAPREEWEILRSDGIPRHDDLSGQTMVADEQRCNIM